SFVSHDTAPSATYTLSLHDALPISGHGAGPGARGVGPGSFGQASVGGGGRSRGHRHGGRRGPPPVPRPTVARGGRSSRNRAIGEDRKSTRLNSSHVKISYAVFCLKK